MSNPCAPTANIAQADRRTIFSAYSSGNWLTRFKVLFGMWDGWDRSTLDMPASVESREQSSTTGPFRKPGSVRFGRYEVLEPIASGGMGVVYAAYDPKLDRKVAIKVVHPRRSQQAGAHARLLREARALARLDHANVVKVHDVISIGEQIVIVMELAAGETLASWWASEHRAWPAIVAAYVQAGEGLAAAHKLNIIHRDFKPSNAIIGADDRVRVLDFGLARLVGAEGALVSQQIDDAVTHSSPGSVVGTLAFAAPEQLSGDTVTPLSDQFSFCVALHHAIEGTAPFVGHSPSELMEAIRSGTPSTASDSRRIPIWLRALVRRGLSYDPAHRHSSMRALLDELTRRRGWRRWRTPSVAILAIGCLVASVEFRRADPTARCESDATSNLWSTDDHFSLGIAFGQLNSPYASEVADQITAALDDRVKDLRIVLRGACIAHLDGATSDAMFDRETSCLSQRAADVESAVKILRRTNVSLLDQAPDLVAGLPEHASCTDVAKLAGEPFPPSTPVLRMQVELVREAVRQAATLRRAGRVEESGRVITSAVANARSINYAPVLAESLLESGRISMARDDNAQARDTLYLAADTGFTHQNYTLALQAVARGIYAEAVTGRLTLPQLEHDAPRLEAMSQGLVDDRFVRPLLLLNIGASYAAMEHMTEALTYYERAHAIVATDPDRDIELLGIDGNLAMLTSDSNRRWSLLTDILKEQEKRLGPNHMSTLRTRLLMAEYEGDEKSTSRDLVGVCRMMLISHPGLSPANADCQFRLSFLAEEEGDVVLLRTSVENLRVVAMGSQDDSVVIEARLASAILDLHDNNTETALAELRHIVAERANSSHSWERRDAYFAELFLGRELHNQSYLSSAAAGFAELIKLSPLMTRRLAFNLAKRTLASIDTHTSEN